MNQKNIIEKLIDKLGSNDFVKPCDLVKVGLFNSTGSVRRALDRGEFPCLHVTSRRTLIDRESVIEHVRRNSSGV